MELIKENWTDADIIELNNYLASFSKGQKAIQWEQNLINTSLPCLAVPSKTVNDIAKQIVKGNYLSFLELWPWQNFNNTTIIAYIISNLKDLNLQKIYLLKYVDKIDNWASCDTLKFKINNKNYEYYFSLAKELLKSEKQFTIRAGLLILLKLTNFNEFIDDILQIINQFDKQSFYYVDMMLAWLLCECFIKHREKTLHFMQNCNLNKFAFNKAISKCRDSFRVSSIDKETLLRLKK